MTGMANALCFGPDLAGSGVTCRLEVSPQGISITFLDERPSPLPVIPFTAVSVGSGGIERDHLVVKWKQDGVERTLYVKDPAVIVAFRRAAPAGLFAELERAAAEVRRVRAARRLLLWSTFAALVAFIVGLWLGFDSLARAAVARVPVEWEAGIGRAGLEEFLTGRTVLKEEPAVAAVEEMMRRLTESAPDNPYVFRVSVVRSDLVNAFALPGGFIVVFTGLLEQARSPEEVAGVLAHEVSHVLHRHGMERMVKNLGLVAVVTIFTGNQQGLAALARRMGVELIALKFGREQELEADLSGVALLHRARIKPDGMVGFFQRLSERDAPRIELLSTHPMSAGRAERARRAIERLDSGRSEPFSFDWTLVQRSLELSAGSRS